MSATRYERLGDLFAEACELPRDQRRAFVKYHCADEPELARELLLMLEEDESSLMVLADETPRPSPPAESTASAPPVIEGYSIRGLLGEGGMGTVWRAVHAGTQREVALKIVSNLRLRASKARARFEREVELCARLTHPHIARIYDNGIQDGFAYYSMELVEGQAIDEYLRQQSLPLSESLRLMIPICRAVEHAHQRGIIHRDLKPSNILVDHASRPMLVDFGLAKGLLDDADERVSLEGEILGTPAYMSPEQAAGQRDAVDTRSDVYSLGVLLYRFITGNMPHDPSGSSYAVMQRIATQDIRPPRRFRPSLDRDLEAILLKALEHAPQGRYSSAGQLATDIEDYLAGRPVSAQVPSTAYYVSKWLRAHWIWAILFLLANLLIMGAVAAFLWTSKKHEREALILARAATNEKQAADDARQQAEQMSHMLQLHVAAEEISNFRYRRALQLLETFPPERRGWEWHFLMGQASPRDLSVFQTRSFDQPVRCLAFSPDGRKLAAAVAQSTQRRTENPYIALFDATTGGLERQLEGHTDGVFAVAFSPDGQQLLSGGKDQTFRRWRVSDGELLETYVPSPEQAQSWTRLFMFDLEINQSYVAFSANPAGLFVGPTPPELSWQAIFDNSRLVVHLPGERGAIAFDHAGKQLAWVTLTWQEETGHLFLVDLETLEIRHHHIQPPGNPFTDVTFSPDDATVATCAFDGILRLWSTADLKLQREIHGHQGILYHAYFINGGDKLVTIARDELIRIWDLARGETTRAFYSFRDASGVRMALSPDQTRLATVQNPAQAIRIWQLGEDLRDTSLLGNHDGKVRDSAVSPIANMVASAGEDGQVRLVDADSRRVLWSRNEGKQYATAVAFSQDGERLAVGRSVHPAAARAPYGELRIYDVATGQPIQPSINLPKWVWDIEWDASGQFVLVGMGMPGNRTGERIGEAALVDLQSGHTTVSVATDGMRCRGVTFVPELQAFATASESEVAVWDRGTGRMLVADVAREGRNFVKVMDGRLITGNQDRIEFRDASTLKLQQALKQTRMSNERFGFANVADVSFSPDGQRMVSAAWNKTLTIWELESGAPLLTFRAHDAGVHHVQFTPDGNSIISSGHDGAVRIWQKE